MRAENYDIVVIGGGLGGSTFGKTMAEHGTKVLIIESTKEFTDRVRGEQMHPWGVHEAKELGIYSALDNSCGHHLPWWDVYVEGERTAHRNLPATTPQKSPEFSFYHPDMQEILLQAASEAGADVMRGATARNINRQDVPSVVVSQNNQVQEYSARLIVGADGRNSVVRKSTGFAIQRDPAKRQISGLIFKNMPMSEDTSYVFSAPGSGKMGVFFPQGGGTVRVYLMAPYDTSQRLQGNNDIHRFIGELLKLGAPDDFFKSAEPYGPLATFDGTDTWVEHPHDDGIALIGDAAASNDPSFGCGLSLTLRDVRVLRDRLLAHPDWKKAGNLYATEHDQYYGILHTVTHWVGQMLFDVGPVADERRARAMPLMAEDDTRRLDHIFSGPDKPVNEQTRRRYFGEE